ncbi:SMC family ATPase [Selenomonas sp. TAMA-11512]|uniref:SMC family ATPase n=1 Tax=Selenomonas sp. TAMA-11512 TaxID=3095337 RepID=UPI0030886501|nr:SMC family ATPase [Selenomonas sp. TAMA-11512]
MRPLTLRMKAFASYKSETYLDFASIGDENFFLIHGNTGAGKTSILDAIVYALYGGEGTMGGRSNLIMRNTEAAPEDLTEVDFHFALRDEHYRVHRTITQKQKRDGSINPTPTHSAALYRYVGGKETLIDGRNQRTVTQSVIALIGLGAVEFRQVVLLPQGAFRDFLLAEPKDRRELFSKIFQTQRFQRLAEKLQEKAAKGADRQQRLIDRRKLLLEQTGAEDFESFLQSIRALEEEEKVLQDTIAPLKEESAARQTAYEQGLDAERKLQQYEQAKAQLKAATEERDRQAEARSLLAAAKKAAALQETKTHLDAARKKSDDTAQEIERTGRKLEELAERQKETQQAYEAATGRDPQLEKLHEERRVLAEQSKHLDNYRQAEKALAEKQALAAAAKADADAAEQAVPSLKAEREDVNRSWRKAVELASRLDGLEHAQSDLQKGERILREGKELASEIKTLEDKSEKEKIKLDNAAERAATLAKEAEAKADARILGQAHELARRLKKGSPCPVCGSTHHPAPQLSNAAIPTEDEVKAVRAAAQKAETLRQKLDAAYVQLQNDIRNKSGKRDELRAEWSALPKLDRTKEELSSAIREARKAKENAPAYKERYEALSKAIDAAELTAKEKKALCDARIQEAQASQGALVEIQKLLPANVTPEALEAKRVRVEAEIASITTDKERARTAFERVKEDFLRVKTSGETLERSLKIFHTELAELEASFRQRLKQASFASVEAWANALTGEYATESGRDALENRLQEVDRSHAAAQGALSAAEAAVKDIEAPDLEKLKAAAEFSLEAWNKASAEHTLKAKEIQDKRKLQKEIENILADEKALDSEYGVLARLAEVANGRADGGQRRTRMDLETYVLRLLLSDVIEAANHRLIKISQGQYLLDPPNMDDIDSHSGLDFTIFDEDTGGSRSLASLSGGESFIVALSLSLGLSDTIVYYARSRPLEMLFIDEGFGSLDADRLDIAIKTLLELRDTGRLVGIISHVEELKHMISVRLEVTKSTSTGSHARFVTNG